MPTEVSAETSLGPVVVSRAAAWMADWSMYIDEPSYQDPEVAIADGYGEIPLPPGALSVIGMAAGLLPIAAHAGGLRREWEVGGPIVVGATLMVHVSATADELCARFESADGVVVATERLIVSSFSPQNSEEVKEPERFCTGPIDRTRLRALCWSLGEFDAGRDWTWGSEPELVRSLAERVVAPGLVAGRAVVSGRHAARRIIGITVRSTAADLTVGEAVCAEVVHSGETKSEVVVSSAGRRLADVTIRHRP